MKLKYLFLNILFLTVSVAFAQIGQNQLTETLSLQERELLTEQIQNSDQDDWAIYKGARSINDDVLLKFKKRHAQNSEPSDNPTSPETVACPTSLTTTFADDNGQRGNFLM